MLTDDLKAYIRDHKSYPAAAGVNLCADALGRILALTSKNEAMRKALEDIAGLELGSRGAYSKFATAQSTAQAVLSSLKEPT